MSGNHRDAPDAIPELDTERPTGEVASEGGSPGDVEIDRADEVGTGSEAGGTWRTVHRDDEVIHRDETGIGRRSPSGDE